MPKMVDPTVISAKLERADRHLIEAVVVRRGITLSDWLREVALEAARRELGGAPDSGRR